MNCIIFIAFIFLTIVLVFIVNERKNKCESFMVNECIQNRKMDNQLVLFTFSTFSTDCCPSTYTSSSGCLCDDFNEFETISNRGGNRNIHNCHKQ